MYLLLSIVIISSVRSTTIMIPSILLRIGPVADTCISTPEIVDQYVTRKLELPHFFDRDNLLLFTNGYINNLVVEITKNQIPSNNLKILLDSTEDDGSTIQVIITTCYQKNINPLLTLKIAEEIFYSTLSSDLFLSNRISNDFMEIRFTIHSSDLNITRIISLNDVYVEEMIPGRLVQSIEKWYLDILDKIYTLGARLRYKLSADIDFRSSPTIIKLYLHGITEILTFNNVVLNIIKILEDKKERISKSRS